MRRRFADTEVLLQRKETFPEAKLHAHAEWTRGINGALMRVDERAANPNTSESAHGQASGPKTSPARSFGLGGSLPLQLHRHMSLSTHRTFDVHDHRLVIA